MTKTERIAELRRLIDQLPGNTSQKCRAIAKILCKKENTIRIALMDNSPRPLPLLDLKVIKAVVDAANQDRAFPFYLTVSIDALPESMF